MENLYISFSRISFGFILLKIGLIFTITLHLIAPGLTIIPYIDIFGYLIIVVGLVVVLPLSKKFSSCILFISLSSFLSATAYIFLSKTAVMSVDGPISGIILLDLILSVLVTIFDLITIFTICNILLGIGIEYKSQEVSHKAYLLKRCLIWRVVLFFLDNYYSVIPFLMNFAMFISGALKLLLIMCIVYVYMYLVGLFNVTRRLLYIYNIAENTRHFSDEIQKTNSSDMINLD